MTSAVSPRLVIKPDRVHHQGVAFPVADRIPEPGRPKRGVVRAAVGPDLPDIMIELENHEHPAGTLDDLHWERMQIDPRHPWREAAGRTDRGRIDRVIRILHAAGPKRRLVGLELFLSPGGHGRLFGAVGVTAVARSRHVLLVPNAREIVRRRLTLCRS